MIWLILAAASAAAFALPPIAFGLLLRRLRRLYDQSENPPP